jgi:putative transposase
VYIPKVGSVGIRQSQPVEGDTKSATFKRDSIGNWDVTLVAEFQMTDTALAAVDPAKVIGIDLGLKDFAVLSNEERIPAPKFFRKRERKLRGAQRLLSRREKGSSRRLKAKRGVSLVQAKTANQRKDFLHKLTTDLVVKYDGICIEDLCVKGLATNQAG